MRLIDADAKIVAQLYDDEHEEWILKEMTVDDYLSFSDTSIPFVDAVPVVRCNQCVFYEGVHGVRGHAPCKRWPSGGVMWNDYCSYGQRREDGDA